MTRPAVRPLRCAIYTRVSTEHGLEQEFNSLGNQHEAAEAYVKSQAHEGWRCLKDRYDDGGFSGGSMERPALQRLLVQIRERNVDVVVVYKVDRLTRSLTDFAKLVELFDQHGVSFVSVTQAFNTTTSMGRLTLNVLLSFAQFEREVTGERIRDKIAASKKKGIWMGGVVPLGYRVEARALHVVEEHAAVIRTIFSRYIDLGSVSALKADLDRAAIPVPDRIDGAGRACGGKPFNRGHLYKILGNPIYVGRLAHKGQVHDGQHQAIVDQPFWDSVQAQLAANTRTRQTRQRSSEHLLTGKIRDDQGTILTPTHAQKGVRRYRYYVSQAALRGEHSGTAIGRIPAREIEAAVVEALRSTISTSNAPCCDADLVRDKLQGVTIRTGEIEIAIRDATPVTIPWSPAPSQRRREIIVPEGAAPRRPMKVEDRARILLQIATARAWVNDLTTGKLGSTDEIAVRDNCSERSVRMTLALAFLSPQIIASIISGQLPRGIGATRLAELPSRWFEQQRALTV